MDTTAPRRQLEAILARCHDLEARFKSELDLAHPAYLESAKNLLHYAALRQFDLRELQDELAMLGLSSLGRSEQHVMATIRAVLKALLSIGGGEAQRYDPDHEQFRLSRLRTDAHAADLLGPCRDRRDVRIMVTLGDEAAEDCKHVGKLIEAGTDIVRINCAHDDREQWLRMLTNIERAKKETGRDCKIVMDLAGHKHRTGHLTPGPRVTRLRPRRDALGRVISPRRIRLVDENSRRVPNKAALLPVPAECIERARPGDEIRLKDTRGKKRKLNVVAKDKKGLVVELFKTAYIATGTMLRLISRRSGDRTEFAVGRLPAVEQPIVLRVDDVLVLERGNAPGEAARVGGDGTLLRPAHVACRPGEIFDQVAVGDPVMLNDGKIEGEIQSASPERLVVRISRAKATGSRLRSDRGINFPGSDLVGRGLTESDEKHIGFIAERADVVGLSFVREPADVIALQQELARVGDSRPGIILKIETERAFNDLPRILLAAMRSYPTGVMIARGDLAVECGWVRLAEIQEEILWLCEAAQLPVVWATQVLEGEAKNELPTRAEITDAAMSQRADCVMLNKGPHILAAIRMLDDILRRMQQHQYKKFTRLRRLHVADL